MFKFKRLPLPAAPPPASPPTAQLVHEHRTQALAAVHVARLRAKAEAAEYGRPAERARAARLDDDAYQGATGFMPTDRPCVTRLSQPQNETRPQPR